ncbi:uncharacterized protein PRCAT00005757001 [Priceomyces carsonii]|uniref:uncharacterized protein n=1 Tax=Priceomyces carsonii TaxID=28549 RepID=UPI002ED850A7|nr:unnamed protein product [Priceomyces carsonii]
MDNRYNEDDDNNDDDPSYKQFETHDGIVFLIGLSPEMLLPLKELNYTSQLFEILSSINDLMSELIITMPQTGIGIYIYNCESSSLTKQTKIPGLTRIFTLNDMNVPNMKTLSDAIMDDARGISPIDKKIIYKPPKDSEQLPVILNKMMDELNRKKQYNSKKLIWFTNNDKPYTKNSTKENLWRIINDFDSLRYFIKPIFLEKYTDANQREKEPFNMKLYQDIFLNTNYLKSTHQGSEYRDNVFQGVSKNSYMFQSTLLSRRIRSSIFRLKEVRRIMFSCNLYLGDGESRGLGCSVKGYALYLQSKVNKFKHIYTKGEHPKTVHLDTVLKDQETNEEISLDEDLEKPLVEKKDSANIKKGFQLSGGRVLYLNSQQQRFLKNYTFDHDPGVLETVKMKQSTNIDDSDEDYNSESSNEEENDVPSFSKPPYLKLLGFRDVSRFQAFYNISPPILVTPDLYDGLRSSNSLGGFQNSFTTFSSLYQSCVELKKFVIVFGCTKRNSLPNLYALYPTRIEFSSRAVPNQREFPEGFLLIRMPWLGDIRSLPNDFLTDLNYCKSEVPEKVIKGFHNLIDSNLFESFNPGEFPNPSLNYFYKIIKHNLLQIELPASEKALKENDVTAGKVADIRSELSKDPQKLSQIRLINESIDALAAAHETTTYNTNLSEELAPKRIKTDSISESAIIEGWKSKSLNSFTVLQLKEFAKRYPNAIKVGHKKQDLVDNVIEFLSSRKS